MPEKSYTHFTKNAEWIDGDLEAVIKDFDTINFLLYTGKIIMTPTITWKAKPLEEIDLNNILRFIHFANNDDFKPDGKDKLWKIRPLVNRLKYKFSK